MTAGVAATEITGENTRRKPDGIEPGRSALVPPEELCTLPFVSSPRNQVRREIEEDALHAHGIGRRRVVLEFGHPEAMKQAVRSHAGVAFVMETSVRDELARGLIRHVATPGLDLPVPVFMVHNRGKTFSDFQERLMDFVRTTCINDKPPVAFLTPPL